MLNKLRDECLRIAVEHGFTDASFPEDMALIHSEVSEALEEYRFGLNPNDLGYEEQDDRGRKPMKPVGIPSELADVIIRVLHVCGKHGIDIENAVNEKMKFNESRPYKHGKKI